MKNYKAAYLKSKENSWSYATYKAEASRIVSIPDRYLERGDAAGFYQHCLQTGYKPYSIKTLFIRAGELQNFIAPAQANPFKDYMKQNARLFKHVYTAKQPSMTFDQAVARIKAEMPNQLAQQALALLASGLRISEANNVATDGTVIGKGSKRRSVANAPTCVIEPSRLRAALTKIGLTPHMLRKLSATKAVELGAREADLLAMFGWSSAQTASLYVQATNTAAVAAKMRGAL